MKRWFCNMILIFLAILLLTNIGLAKDDSRNLPVFNQKVMMELREQGYQWRDLVEASKLVFKHNISIYSILQMRPDGIAWNKVDQALHSLKQTKKELTEKKLSDPHLLSLVNEGLTDDQIALLVYFADIRDESVESLANKVKTAKKGDAYIEGVEEIFKVNLASVDAEYVVNATGTSTEYLWGIGYDVEKNSPFHAVVNNQQESISPATGFLMITATDLTLPGKNGLDFVLRRVYRSEKAELQTFGYDYELEDGTCIKYRRNYLNQYFHLGTGWGFDLPLVEVVPNTSIPLFLHMGTGSTYGIDLNSKTGLYDVTTEDYKFIKNYTSPVTFVLKHKSGINYHFDNEGRITAIKNHYGNQIQFTWNSNDYLTTVIDSLGRQITFDYTSTPGFVIVTANIGQTPYQIKYKKTSYKTPLDEDRYSQSYSVLERVEYPEQVVTSYSYSCDPVVFDSAITGFNINLTSAVNPYNGQSTYIYSKHQKDELGAKVDYYKATSRYDVLNGLYQNYTTFDYIETTSMENTSVYYYGDHVSTYFGSPYAKKEVFTYDPKTHLNTMIETEIPSEGGSNREKKVFTYYNKLPEFITTTQSKDGTSGTSTVKVDLDYNNYGSIIYSGDSEGRKEETSYRILTINDFYKEVLDWNRKQINPTETNQMEFMQQNYAYDAYGNVTTFSEKELDASYAAVTEDLVTSNTTLSSQNTVWYKYLHKSSSQWVAKYDWYANALSSVTIAIRCWEEGTIRPSTPNWTKTHTDGIFTPNTGSDASPAFTLDKTKKYIFEISYSGNGSLTIKDLNLTYDKPTFVETLKQTIYNHYASPATFGSPDIVHMEYCTTGHSGSFAGDGCIVTKYEYGKCIDDDPLTSTPEPVFANLFPTKISQYYIDVDGKGVWEITEYLYNHFGQVNYAKKGNISTMYLYDGIQRIKQEITTSNRTLHTNYTYSLTADARGYYYTTISHQDQYGNGADQHISRYYYNRLGQPVETQKGPVTAPISLEKIEYDGFGRKKSIEDGIGVKTVFEYDGSGRTTRTSIKDKNGTEKTYKKISYNNAIRTVTEQVYEKKAVDQLIGKTVQYLYNTGNVQYVDQYPELVTNPSLKYRTQYTYNYADQVTSVINPNNVKIGYSYDFFGISEIDYPLNEGSVSEGVRKDDEYIYEYSGRAQHVKKKLGDNVYITTYYDDLGRVKKILYPDGRVMKNYYDAAGRLSRTILNSSTQSTEIAYEYDLTGNVNKATHTYDGTSYILRFGYDEKGNVTSVTYPDGYSISYTYDAYGRIVTIPGLVESPGVTYLNNGFIKTVSYKTRQLIDLGLDPSDPKDPIGVYGLREVTVMETTTYTPDNLGRIQSVQNDYLNYSYTYDAKGNVTAITGSDQFTGVANYSYTYNDLDWLKTANHGGTTYVYNYDAAGNRTAQVINGNTISYTYDPAYLNLLKQINGTSVLYDGWGNITKRDNGFEYSYNNSNQLNEVRKKGRVVENNYYNSEGKRYKKIESGKGTHYVYHGEVLLYAEAADGTKTNYIYLNGKQIAKVETKNGVQSKYYYFTDHLGSTRGMIGYDGKLVGTVYYEPFGDEKPYYPGRDSSLPNQSSLENVSDITGRVTGTTEVSTDHVEGNYSLKTTVGTDPVGSLNARVTNSGTVDTEKARYFYIWVKPEDGAQWVQVMMSDLDDPVREYEYLTADDGGTVHSVTGGEIKSNQWNLVLVDTREGNGDGIDKNTNYFRWLADDNSIWKWDAVGVSLKDPVTFTGKQQDDTTGLYYFNARYYDPDLGRFITEDPIRDGANWYVYCENNPLKYVDPSGLWTRDADGNWIAEKGDTLWGLSEIIFGDGKRWQELGYQGDAKSLKMGAIIVDLGKGWRGRVDNPHVPGDKKHAHYEKNGKEVWNENEDGTPHHPNKQIEEPGKKIKQRMKEKTGWSPNSEPAQITTYTGGLLIGGYLIYQGVKYTVAIGGAPWTGGSSLLLILTP